MCDKHLLFGLPLFFFSTYSRRDGQENYNLKKKMGSAKIFSSKPQSSMAELTDKKSIKNILRRPFQAIFQRVDSKRRSKNDVQKVKTQEVLKEPSIKPILSLLENLTIDDKDGKDGHTNREILENFEYLTIDNSKPRKIDSNSCEDVEHSARGSNTESETRNDRIDASESKPADDATHTATGRHEAIDNTGKEKVERSEKNGTSKHKTNEDCRNERIDSNSSNDSGYSDKVNDADKESIEAVVDCLEELKVEEGEKKEKKKKLQKVYVSRAPIKLKQGNANYHPYQQISQVNKQTFSGGQVIVKSTEIPERSEWQDIPHEIDLAISQVNLKVNDFTKNTHEEQVDRWNIAQEFVTENQKDEFLKGELENFVFRTLENDLLLDFAEVTENTNYEIGNIAPPSTQVNPIDEFNEKEYFNNDFESQSINSLDELLAFNLTPPRSNENAHESPVPVPCSPKSSFYCTPPYTNSMSSGTYNSPNSDYILSPERSSPSDLQNDYENYQDLPVFDEQNLPSCVDNSTREIHKEAKKTQRSSSITMRTVKDILKRLNMEFSKSQCCQKMDADSKNFFQEQFQKFSIEERKSLCLKVTNIELNATYGVLQNILLSLGTSCEKEGLHYALFSLLCERVLAQSAVRFLGDFGLSLLKLAALRCPTKPILVRHLVRCIRRALSSGEPRKPNAPLYNEVDALGENLVGACARAGDAYADVLAELIRCDKDGVPLFDIAHRNTEGYSPLHVACLQDGAEAGADAGTAAAGSRRWLRTIHVLLAHAHLDLTEGDTKGGDTALHLAVNSRRATLELVLALMAHAPRSQWKQLAHCPNRSSMTPLEYARSATKSQLHYPIEVLDFLKKCR